MREQVEALEHHAQFGTLLGHFLVVQGLQHAFAALVDVFVADHLAVNVDFAASQRLQLVGGFRASAMSGISTSWQ